MRDMISIRGAREHNLKGIDLDIPRNRLVVVTGVSGSGKSTLAFDTLFAEGQRRYVESLSAYARQFLEQMDKPDVDTIEGLSPAISIEQKTTSKNPRSTVATVTEIYDYLRLLYASIGVPECPDCHLPIQGQTTQQMVDRILAMPDGARFSILAPADRLEEGGAPQALRADGAGRVRAGTRQRRAGGRRQPARARQEAQAHDRGRDRPPGSAGRPRQPPRSTRWRPRSRWGMAWSASPSADGEELRPLLASRLPQLRVRARRAVAAHLLLQLAPGCLPRVHRPRHGAGGRPGEGRPGPRPHPRGRAPWPASRRAGRSFRWRQILIMSQAMGFPLNRPWRVLARGGARRNPVRHRAGAGLRLRRRAQPLGVPRAASRASSATSSGAIARPPRRTCAPRSSATCRCGPCHSCGGKRLRREALAVRVRRPQHPRDRVALGARRPGLVR